MALIGSMEYKFLRKSYLLTSVQKEIIVEELFRIEDIASELLEKLEKYIVENDYIELENKLYKSTLPKKSD